jgi:hypothetical protein
VRVGLDRVVQQKLAVELVGAGVGAQFAHLEPAEAAQCVHLRADRERVEQVALGSHAPRQFGVTRAFGVADQLQRGTGAGETDRFDQLAAQHAKCAVAHEDGPPVVQPDAALGRRKAKATGQIFDIRKVFAVAFPAIDQAGRIGAGGALG